MKVKGKSNLKSILAMLLVLAFTVSISAIPVAYADNAEISVSDFYTSDNNLTLSDMDEYSYLTVTSSRNYSGSHNDLFGVKLGGIEGISVISFKITNVANNGNGDTLRLGIRANEDMENQFDSSFLNIESVEGAQKTTLNGNDCAYIELSAGDFAVVNIVFGESFTSNTSFKFSPYAYGSGFVGSIMLSEFSIGVEEDSSTESSSFSDSDYSDIQTETGVSSKKKKTSNTSNEEPNLLSILFGVVFICLFIGLVVIIAKKRQNREEE